MPLKLLKRTSKQYNVVSKSTFVLSVTLLDNGIMECTLDADSTGNHCLQNISQRLGLHQVSWVNELEIGQCMPLSSDIYFVISARILWTSVHQSRRSTTSAMDRVGTTAEEAVRQICRRLTTESWCNVLRQRCQFTSG